MEVQRTADTSSRRIKNFKKQNLPGTKCCSPLICHAILHKILLKIVFNIAFQRIPFQEYNFSFVPQVRWKLLRLPLGTTRKKTRSAAPKKLPAHTMFLILRNKMFWFIYVLKLYDQAYHASSTSIFHCADWDEFQSVHYPQSPGHIPLIQPSS